MKNLIRMLFLCLPLAALAASMTNDDVIRMVRGGLNDTTVIQAIDGSEPNFDTSPDGLVRLKQGGVSDAVIQRILARRGAPPVAASVCVDCGTVTGIREINKPGQATGVGAVAGGVLGAVVGRQVGGSGHRTAGTVVGAAGGAVAGHMIEKKAREGKIFEIGVRFDDGSSRTFTYDAIPAWNTGSRVKVVNGALTSL